MKTSLPLIALILMLLLGCNEQEEPLVLDEGRIESAFHQAHAGKVVFLKKRRPVEELKEEQLGAPLELVEEDEFLFYILQEKTQTYYLHQLAPELSVNETCKKGSYQLRFFVDGEPLYEENIQTGAGSCWFRNSATHPLVLLISEDEHWGKYTWTRFLNAIEGAKVLLDGQSHDFGVEVRPYIQLDSLIVGPLIASGTTRLTFLQSDVDPAAVAVQPLQPAAHWTPSKASYEQGRIEALNTRIAQRYFKNITSVAVLKKGELLIEEYFNGADRNTLHDTRSVGKSLCGTVMGIAIGEGHISGADARLGDFYKLKEYAHYSPEKAAVLLKELLTMSSGFEGSDMDPNSPGNEENMYPTADWVKFTLDLPLDPEKTPGQTWDYFTAGVVVLGDILHQQLPGGLEQYAAEKLLGPLHIDSHQWQYTPQNVANTAGGFQTTTLNFARYGQLYLDGGQYEGQQIVPAAWISESLSDQVELPEMAAAGTYGYLFWNKEYEVAGKRYRASYASGNGGNKVMVIPELELVIVLTATAYGQPYMHTQADEIIQ
ncbi:MAG: serine hydrolase, partial [Phaeodactylibacter sp.]|nr:serine hydrolase [Phaeodactylibacter sp.]